MEKKNFKYYLVDAIILSVPVSTDMPGFQEIPSEWVEEPKPCNTLVELYKKAKRGKQHED